MLTKFMQNEEGQGMVEYGLILALIAVVVVAAVGVIGTNLNTMFEGVGSSLAS